MKSNFINTEPNDKSILPVAKNEFAKLANTLHHQGLISKYQIDESEGVKLTLFRSSDNKELFIKVDSDGEIFYRLFDQSYLYLTSEHEHNNKLQVLDDLIHDAKWWVGSRDYYEEIFEKNGKVLYKRLVFANGGSESVSYVFLGWIRKFFCKKRINRPH